MDNLIVYMIDKFGWGALVIGVGAYLVIESMLDVLSGALGDWIRTQVQKRRERRRETDYPEW